MCKPIRKINNLLEHLMRVIDHDTFKNVDFDTFYDIDATFVKLVDTPYENIKYLQHPDNHNFKIEFSV